MLEKRRVVVTGLGLATPLGLGIEENWEKALSGKSGIAKLNLAGTERSSVQAVGSVKEDDWNRIVDEFKEEASIEGERRTLFALWSAKSALDDSRCFDYAGNTDRFGVVFAAGLGIVRLEDIHQWVSEKRQFDMTSFGREYHKVHRESMIRNLSHRPAALIAKKYGLSGLNCTVTSACASASQAIGIGYRAVQRGDADLILAGGADSMINHMGLVVFVLLRAASTGSKNSQAACRPFDRRRSGLVIGEGAGVAVLEEETHARKRGAPIYAEIVGYGSSMDAYQVTAPHPEGYGASEAMRCAIQDSNLAASEIDYINAHGTGTKLNDTTETMAIKRIFKEWSYKISISSSKSLIGHLMAAAGGPEFVYTVLSVHRDEIHPTINLTNRDLKCDLDYVPNVKRTRTVRAALSNSFGFGGQNASIVIKKYIN